MSLLCYFPVGPVVKGDLLMVHAGVVLSLIMLLLYIKLDFVVGLVCFAIYFPGYMLGNSFFYELGDEHLKIIGAAHAFSWVAQFIGHGLFENRRPALVDNLLLTLAAPMFVVLEVMFFLGYNPSYSKEIHEFESRKDKRK
jgi:uncharacterized membrane protein YGL010W